MGPPPGIERPGREASLVSPRTPVRPDGQSWSLGQLGWNSPAHAADLRRCAETGRDLALYLFTGTRRFALLSVVMCTRCAPGGHHEAPLSALVPGLPVRCTAGRFQETHLHLPLCGRSRRSRVLSAAPAGHRAALLPGGGWRGRCTTSEPLDTGKRGATGVNSGQRGTGPDLHLCEKQQVGE